MDKQFKQQLNELIILMYQEQESNNPQVTSKLSKYINALDKYKGYKIIKQLIANGLTNWKVQKGAHNDVVFYPETPNLTDKGIKIAKFLLKPDWQKFLIIAKNKIIALIIFLLGLGILNISININY